MSGPRRTLHLLIVAAPLAACREASGPEVPAVLGLSAITTGRPVRVDFTVTNIGTERIHVSRCGDRIMAAVDRAAGTRWQDYSGDGCLTHQDMSPLPIDPGVTLSSSRAIIDSGRFRLRIRVVTAGGVDFAWTVASEGFEIRLP